MNFSIYKRLLKYIKPYIFLLIIGLIIASLYGSCMGIIPLIINKYLASILKERNKAELLYITRLSIALAILSAIFRYTQDYIFYYISSRLIQYIRFQFFSHLQILSVDFFERVSSGEIVSRINNDTTLMQRGVTTLARDFTSNLIKVIFYITYLVILNPMWSFFIFVIFPVVVIPLRVIGRRLKKYSHRILERSADISVITEEASIGARIVRAFCLENIVLHKFKEHNDKQFIAMMKSIKYSEMANPLIQIIAGIFLGSIMYYGGVQVIKGYISLNDYITFIATLLMLSTPVKGLGRILTNLQSSVAAAERVYSILDMKPAVKEREDALENFVFNDRIEYKNVKFRYPQGDRDVIRGISFEIKKGEVVALVGLSGAGKTTIADLLLRFYDVNEGSITIDGVDIREYKLHTLRQHIALVTQDTFLFDDTVKNNILYGNPTASFEKVKKAAELALADGFIQSMPLGYDTFIGERGIRLSGGEKQRLAIARAIIKDAPILILDEATSNLDTHSEMLVQKALENLMKDKTALVIAHRLSTIKHADKILVIENGKIVEAGTHESLLKQDGVYKKLFTMQAHI